MAQSRKRMLKNVEDRVREFCANMDDEVADKLVNDLRDIIAPSLNPSMQQKMIDVLDEVTGLMHELNGGQLAKFADELLDKAHVAPEFIRKNYGEGGPYWDKYWAGQRGDMPNEKHIRASLGLALRGWPSGPTKQNFVDRKPGMKEVG